MNDLGHDYITRYVALRSAKRIGVIWTVSDVVMYSPLPYPHSAPRQPVLLAAMKKMIDYWYPGSELIVDAVPRKPAHSEYDYLPRFRQQSR